jgi:fido (protein-threonine AMPylation protein)
MEVDMKYDIESMQVIRKRLEEAIDGDKVSLGMSFMWVNTPQGATYWHRQSMGNLPLDIDALKEIHRQAFGDEKEETY